jgi:hypothetical protein
MDGGWGGGSSIKTGACVCRKLDLSNARAMLRVLQTTIRRQKRTHEDEGRMSVANSFVVQYHHYREEAPNNVVFCFVCRKRGKRAINVEGHSGCGHELLPKCLLARTETRFQMRSSRI